MTQRPKVIIESAFAPSLYTQAANEEFAQRLCAHAIAEGYNPLASHLLYPQFLDDLEPDERLTGLRCGIEWGQHAQEVWLCLREKELPSSGMAWALSMYVKLEKHIKILRCHPDGEVIEVIEEINRRYK